MNAQFILFTPVYSHYFIQFMHLAAKLHRQEQCLCVCVCLCEWHNDW
jgi:hypothetical protein